MLNQSEKFSVMLYKDISLKKNMGKYIQLCFSNMNKKSIPWKKSFLSKILFFAFTRNTLLAGKTPTLRGESLEKRENHGRCLQKGGGFAM